MASSTDLLVRNTLNLKDNKQFVEGLKQLVITVYKANNSGYITEPIENKIDANLYLLLRNTNLNNDLNENIFHFIEMYITNTFM